MWKRHWGLSADPFLGSASSFVRTSSHDEAVARLSDTIESGQRLALLRAGEGLGKSMVLAQTLVEMRSPYRRFARVSSPADGTTLFSGLAESLGAPPILSLNRTNAWKSLVDAVRVCRLQKLHVVLVVDDCQHLVEDADRRDLERLSHCDPNSSTRLTVLQAHRDPEATGGDPFSAQTAWQLVVRLHPLTRSETTSYLKEKLAWSGRSGSPFTHRAEGRIHELSGGIPRGIDRLASLGLMAGALQSLDRVTPEVVEGVAGECSLPWSVCAA